MCIFPVFLLAPWSPTQKSRELADDVFVALDSIYERKVSAPLLGVTEKLLSDWARCQKPLQWSRFVGFDTECPEREAKFHDALLERRAARTGGIYVRPELVTLFRGAASLMKRNPLKAMFGTVERETA